MWTRMFWLEAAERALKSAAQALLGMWALDGLNVLHAHWDLAFGVTAGAAVLSVLTSIVSLVAGPQDSPSLVTLRR